MTASAATPPQPAPAQAWTPAPTIPGKWSLWERKQIGEKQAVLDNAVAAIKARLGDEWSVKIDWEVIDRFTTDRGIDRPAGDNVVVKIVGAFVRIDLAKLTDEMVAATNQRSKDAKVVVFTMKSSVHRGRAFASVWRTTGITIEFSVEAWGMAYDEDYYTQYVEMFMNDWGDSDSD